MFRFTIRDVLWLTTLVALGIGWWVDSASMRIERRQKAQADALDEVKYKAELYEAAKRERLLKIRADESQETAASYQKKLWAERLESERLTKLRQSKPFEFMPAEPGEWLEKNGPTPR